MKVLHVLASNKYSGAENVVCQIINMFDGDVEMAYCSPAGDIKNTLKTKNIQFFGMNKLRVKELKRVVKEFRPDVVHAHDTKAMLYVSMLDKKIKKVGHVHGNDITKMGKISLKSVLMKLIGKKFNHIFWVSNSCLDEFRFKKSIQKQSSVLYNIINQDNLKALACKDAANYDYDVVYLGRLTYPKHPERLIEIASILKNNNANFKMAIVGDGDLANSVNQLIKTNNLEDNVFCLGFMSNAYKLLSQSKLMLMCSRFEGTPMVALEALTLGVPIVTTKTDGMVDLITNNQNGFLYDTNEQAAEHIQNILTNKDLQQRLRDESVKFSAEYNNIEKYKNEIIKAYTEQK